MKGARGMTTGVRWGCSRRAILRGGALAVLAFGVPARAGAQPKIDPKLVKYQVRPKADQECDRCLHFIAPDGCKMVAGKISPKGWCSLFAPKPR
jgi:hypothetical protein